jgi:hypothetical protein
MVSTPSAKIFGSCNSGLRMVSGSTACEGREEVVVSDRYVDFHNILKRAYRRIAEDAAEEAGSELFSDTVAEQRRRNRLALNLEQGIFLRNRESQSRITNESTSISGTFSRYPC